MPDVIVVGAGGGGPVVAKELAARGLDVLLLEAGAAFERSEREWSHFENEANNPATGVFRFGPGDRTQPPVGARPATELLPLADGGRRRLDCALLRQLAARDARGVLRLHGT